MNSPPDPLDRLLKSARLPDPAAGFWEEFPRRVAARLRDAPATPQPRMAWEAAPQPAWKPWLMMAGLAVACLVIGFLIGTRHGVQNENRDSFAKLYREVNALFPNQVDAIVVDDIGTKLLLADRPNVPSSPPILLRICRNGECRTFVTVSGRQIRVNGESWEVLSDSSGNIILTSPRWYWSSREGDAPRDNYRIKAWPLSETL